MLQPVVRRTWAPRGETPVLDCWGRHDRLSAISALTVSPRRRRLGLYFDLFAHNIKADDFETFVARMLERIGRPLTLVLDRWQVHRSAVRRLKARFGGRIHIEWLPPTLRNSTRSNTCGAIPSTVTWPTTFPKTSCGWAVASTNRSTESAAINVSFDRSSTLPNSGCDRFSLLIKVQ